MKFLEEFDVEYADRLGRRASTFRVVLEMLSQRNDLIVVETGCLRQVDNWEGDGQSTLLFDQLAKATQGHVYSVDISMESAALAKSMCSDRVSVFCGDSIDYLARFPKKIDFLYLDSLDLNQSDPLPAAMHTMWELTAANRQLVSGSIVMVDDTFVDSGKICGKGALVSQYMTKIGARLITGDYQMAWEMP